MTYLDPTLQELLARFQSASRKLTVLTGAGLSADSGIPTFRDKDGFWTVGSENYTPQEMGTYEMFWRKPMEVWKWFLYRKTLCSKAEPNAGHFAIKQLEDIFGDRFQLITQNVDGLHTRALSAPEKTYFIHGTLDKSRCGDECSKDFYPFPDIHFEKGQELTDDDMDLLKCPKCGNYLRPHVLWFDEYYDEKHYKLDSSLRTAKETGLLLIVGTSGATNLPRRIVETVLSRQGMIIDINPNSNYFSEIAREKKNGYVLKGSSSDILPEFVEFFSSRTSVENK
ncbi:SIR2 family NAD-dependent protein deacylase [Chitinophaga pinensis]|uniref:protein acetyllysine N-acetyltransferase n=1 Tax=Chitinophaga pinensis TaxID=79329 RepID=A0A5C6LMQ4_9BACT|nr:Sir2 family NAD-dependent protein deacetylase [Chitinophaga pinensis]TWV96224.1 RNA polymerase subunit sigma [Chitinophaga pinensis]